VNVIENISVPDLGNTHLSKLLMLVDASHEPIYVDIITESSAVVSDCFNIVARKVQKEGGKLIFGWQVWLTRHIIEAEAHAVWENPEGELIDVTPKLINISRILFLEDENRNYVGKQIDSIRLNITRNTLVDDLITVSKAIYAFDNRGERANYYDLSELLSEQQINHKIYMLNLKNLINVILASGGTRNTKCPCNGTLKFRDCHGRNLVQALYRIK
jgi:hypothetical protein